MLYTLKNNELTVQVSSLGAELQSLRTADGTEYLWQGDPAYWSGRCLVMFPFCGRNPDGKYSLDGRTYELDTHGFARRSEFALTARTNHSLTLTLCDSERTLAQYPRRFRLSVIFRLTGNALSVRYEIENRDRRTLFFGIGGHPAFRVPLEEGLRLEDYRVEFAEPCQPIRIGMSDSGFLTGKDLPYALKDNAIPLTRELLSHPFCLTGVAESVRLIGGSRGLTMSFPQTEYFALWQVHKPDTPFVCLEPWSSLPAAQDQPSVWEQKADLLRLEPGGLCRREWIVTLE